MLIMCCYGGYIANVVHFSYNYYIATCIVMSLKLFVKYMVLYQLFSSYLTSPISLFSSTFLTAERVLVVLVQLTEICC